MSSHICWVHSNQVGCVWLESFDDAVIDSYVRTVKNISGVVLVDRLSHVIYNKTPLFLWKDFPWDSDERTSAFQMG